MTETTLITLSHGTTTGANIAVTEQRTPTGAIDRYILSWNDGVANAWREEYATLAVALTRVAALVACLDARDDGEGRMFVHGADDFETVAKAFVRGVTY